MIFVASLEPEDDLLALGMEMGAQKRVDHCSGSAIQRRPTGTDERGLSATPETVLSPIVLCTLLPLKACQRLQKGQF